MGTDFHISIGKVRVFGNLKKNKGDVWIPPPCICLDGKSLSPFSGNTKGKYLLVIYFRVGLREDSWTKKPT
jgi:hypothetical protein